MTARHRPLPPWHAGLLALLPAIETHARVSFRHLDPEARQEAVQNAIANATIAYARLYELGKSEVAYALPLARFAVAQTRDGRVIGNRLNVNDVSSAYARQQKGIVVERLDTYDEDEQCWREILLEDRRTGPAEVAIARLDFAAWLKFLPRKLRKVAKVLATNETTTAAAKKFGISPGHMSRMRRQLERAWKRFHGEDPGLVAA